MPLTSVSAEIAILVVLERTNAAASAEPFGTVAGVQFVAVFQSPEVGLRSQSALPAPAMCATSSSKAHAGFCLSWYCAPRCVLRKPFVAAGCASCGNNVGVFAGKCGV